LEIEMQPVSEDLTPQRPGMGLDQSSSVAMSGWVQAIFPCPYPAGDPAIQNLPIRGLAVAMGESRFITKKAGPRVSAAEMVMIADHLQSTTG
jgi:hypothetical protein